MIGLLKLPLNNSNIKTKIKKTQIINSKMKKVKKMKAIKEMNKMRKMKKT